MFKKIFLIFIFGIWGYSAYAQEYRSQFSVLLKQLKVLESQDYTNKVFKIKSKFDYLFEKKKGVCIGEFSEEIFKDKQQVIVAKRHKVSSKTKNRCFLELKEDLLLYYKAIYHQRKQFFIYSNQLQLKKLELDFSALSSSLQKEVSTLKKKVRRSQGN